MIFKMRGKEIFGSKGTFVHVLSGPSDVPVSSEGDGWMIKVSDMDGEWSWGISSHMDLV